MSRPTCIVCGFDSGGGALCEFDKAKYPRIARLVVDRDEVKGRLAAMVGLYDDPGLSERVANEYIVDPTPEQVREVKYVLARVSRMHRAIAEGRGQ